MATIVIPRANWTTALADAIIAAQAGDEIVVHSAAERELAERARQRMAPAKLLSFRVEAGGDLNLDDLDLDD